MPDLAQNLARNAFRILGLTADASQSQIDSAARMMRLFANPNDIPSTPNDAPFLGMVPRKSTDIENAAARLAQPESRVVERLWWFYITPPQNLNARPAAGAAIPARHAAVLLKIAELDRQRNLYTDFDSLALLLKNLDFLANSNDFTALLLEAETKGDFEKAATPDEILSAQIDLPNPITDLLIDSIDRPLQNGSLVPIEKLFTLLDAHTHSSQGTDKLFTRLESHLARTCADCHDQIERAWALKKIDPLKAAARQAANTADASCQPLLQLLLKHTRDDPVAADRLKGPLISLLNYIARAYDACYDYITAETVLEKSLAIARGTPMESATSNRLAWVKPEAEKQRAKFAQQKPPVSRELPHIQTVQAQSRRKPTPVINSGGSRTWLWIAIVAGAAILRALTISHTNNSNYSTPQYTPPPITIPKFDLPKYDPPQVVIPRTESPKGFDYNGQHYAIDKDGHIHLAPGTPGSVPEPPR